MARYELCLAPLLSEIPRLNDWLQSCCRADGVAAALASRLTLAIEEAVSNVIAYGFAALPPPHRIGLRLEITAASVIAEVIDDGRPFDPTAVPEPDLAVPLERRDPGGLGIHLMRAMVDRVEYRRDGGNNTLRLETARR